MSEHRTLCLQQGASESNADGLPSLLFFFFLRGGSRCVFVCVCISAGNVQQSIIFYSVPSSVLVLFITDKSVLVFRNATLCDGFVRIRVFMWQSNARCVGTFCFRLLSFPGAECCLVNKESAAQNSPCHSKELHPTGRISSFDFVMNSTPFKFRTNHYPWSVSL